MNFIEAMRKIDNDGCKIRRKVWGEDIFIISRERIVLENDGSLCDFSFNDYFADDWEELRTSTSSLDSGLWRLCDDTRYDMCTHVMMCDF